MTACRTIAEVLDAADRDSAADPPLTQAQMDYYAALTAMARTEPRAA